MDTILVIDDDRHMRSACSRVLSRAGWSVLCAETGREGLDELRSGRHNIDAVLVDQLMPGMDGLEVLAEIRAISPNVPVILMTGSATDEDASEIRKQGAFECLAKPFTPEQLRNVVRSAVRKPS